MYPEDFDDITLEELEELLLEVKFIRDEPPKHYKTELENYKLKPFNKLTLKNLKKFQQSITTKNSITSKNKLRFLRL